MGSADTVAVLVLMLYLQQPCLTVVADFGLCPRAAIQRVSYLYLMFCLVSAIQNNPFLTDKFFVRL